MKRNQNIMEKTYWEDFFNQHAPLYDQEPFTKNTKAEVDFILEELKLPEGAEIIDIGCGTGRHSIELAKRGFRMTGMDVSEEMLNIAREKAKAEQLPIAFIKADAAEQRISGQFDAGICLCEGGFGLLDATGDAFHHDFAILRNINKMLKINSRFILTALNGLRMIRKYSQEDVELGKFNPVNITETLDQDDTHNIPPSKLKEKGYLVSELNLLFKAGGFVAEHIWGGTAGDWNRHELKMDEMEVMVIARKSKEIV